MSVVLVKFPAAPTGEGGGVMAIRAQREKEDKEAAEAANQEENAN